MSRIPMIVATVLLQAPWVGCGSGAERPEPGLYGTFATSFRIVFIGTMGRPSTICLPRRLARDSAGRVECEVTVEFGTDIDAGIATLPERCDQLAGLEDTGKQTASGQPICRMRQLVAVDGSPPETEDGWYYDEASEPTPEPCNRTPGPVLTYSTRMRVPTGSLISAQCNTALDADGQPIRSDAPTGHEPPSATPKAQTAEVGMACEPEVVPEGGFDFPEALVLVGTEQCASNACLVYHLRGVLDEPCGGGNEPRCARAEDIADRVYCSCRCGVPEGIDDASSCTCPAGFICTEVVSSGPDAVVGSYCRLNNDRGNAREAPEGPQ